ncbi:Wall-associated receptor kinase 5 [Hordeum vulgare]|nr:Wall-associated receptor kinase 5 [Hordeum vulgare]
MRHKKFARTQNPIPLSHVCPTVSGHHRWRGASLHRVCAAVVLATDKVVDVSWGCIYGTSNGRYTRRTYKLGWRECTKYIRVVRHFPEDFIVRFVYHHHRDLLNASSGRFGRGRLDIHANIWRPNAHTDVAKLHYRVHIKLENVPLHGWDEDLISDIIGDECVLHYFDRETLQKEDATAVRLWAWCSDPALIPRVDWLTIVDKPQSGVGLEVMGRTGLAQRVLIHLESLEDFTPDAAGVVPRRPWATPPFRCKMGLIDGEEERRELVRSVGSCNLRYCINR